MRAGLGETGTVHCWQCSGQHWQEERGAAESITVESATPQQGMGCATDVWGRDGAAPWGGEMQELVQGVHWDVTQGPKGNKGCLQRDGARLTLPHTISLGMLPSLGLWPQCHTQWGCAVGTAMCWPREWVWGSPVGSHPSLPIPRPALPLSPGSWKAGEPFPEAVYEEIAYSLAWEKQPRFSLSGGCMSLRGHICRAPSPCPRPGLCPAAPTHGP